jgi:hypothetical protein
MPDHECLSLDDYVACTIEGRIVKVVESAGGKKFTVKYFDNDGIPRLRQLFTSELEFTTPDDDDQDLSGADVVFPNAH